MRRSHHLGAAQSKLTSVLPQIEFPSILLPPDISSGSIVDITVARNHSSEAEADKRFAALQDQIYASFGAGEPATPVLRCRNATQTSVVLEWDPVELATADLISLSLYRNGQKAGNIPRPLQMHSTKISGLAVDDLRDGDGVQVGKGFMLEMEIKVRSGSGTTTGSGESNGAVDPAAAAPSVRGCDGR